MLQIPWSPPDIVNLWKILQLIQTPSKCGNPCWGRAPRCLRCLYLKANPTLLSIAGHHILPSRSSSEFVNSARELS